MEEKNVGWKHDHDFMKNEKWLEEVLGVAVEVQLRERFCKNEEWFMSIFCMPPVVRAGLQFPLSKTDRSGFDLFS